MNISTYPDRELLKIASDFKKHLKDKFPIMKVSSSGLDNGFIYKFKALFYEVQAHPWEPDNDSITARYRLELDALTDEIKTFFMVFRFYLQKTFPYDAELCESYSYVEMQKAAQNYNELQSFLEKTKLLIEEKRSFLRAAHCPDCTLDEIIGLSKQFNEMVEELTKYIQKREIKVKAYQNNMKELFKLMEIVHEAASKSLRDDPESLKHLTFPPREYIH